ncbi:hypothetical protein ACIHCQ_44485 [Streptomyces sp. NPDC052236]|uniref:hypothetical protein n=1 Tax=Streptomyces sp. NPDC052236 TaxID=3365686 RepID=UPI0037D5F24E
MGLHLMAGDAVSGSRVLNQALLGPLRSVGFVAGACQWRFVGGATFFAGGWPWGSGSSLTRGDILWPDGCHEAVCVQVAHCHDDGTSHPDTRVVIGGDLHCSPAHENVTISSMSPSRRQALEEIADLSAFMKALRQLKSDSRLSYRQLEERAAASGDLLPRSTASVLLSRDAVPCLDQLAAFVRACGDGELVEVWLEARDRITGQDQATPPGSDDATPVVSRQGRTDGPHEVKAGCLQTKQSTHSGFPRGRAILTLVAAVAAALGLGAWGMALFQQDGTVKPTSAVTSSLTTVTAQGPDNGFTLFEGRSANGSTAASIGYRYWDTRDGWYGIEYVMPYSRDQRETRMEGWGGTLRMHYEDRHGTHTSSLTENPDGEPDAGMDSVRYGMKNVWFEVCDSDQQDRLRGCQRLHMARL